MGPGQGKGGEVEKTEATEGGMWKVGKKEKKKGKNEREKRRAVQRSRSCGKDCSLNWKTNYRGPARTK